MRVISYTPYDMDRRLPQVTFEQFRYHLWDIRLITKNLISVWPKCDAY